MKTPVNCEISHGNSIVLKQSIYFVAIYCTLRYCNYMSLNVIKNLLFRTLSFIIGNIFICVLRISVGTRLVFKHINLFASSFFNPLPKPLFFLFGHFIPRIVSSVVLVYILSYAIAHGIAYIDKVNCIGWECEEVYCPDGYAVRLPTGEYLPCDVFEEFVLHKNKELLK